MTRRAITLMEVLISMFVMLIGLLGVAAMIVAGRSEVMAGMKLDVATGIARAEVKDCVIRGYLKPGQSDSVSNWFSASGAAVWNPLGEPTRTKPFLINGAQTDLPAVVFDPLGVAAGFGNTFPYGAGGLSLLRICPTQALTNKPLADSIFRGSDDLVLTPSTKGKDFPPDQSLTGGVSRASYGNYSWLATLTPDSASSSLSGRSMLTVAVFFKRDLGTPGAGEKSYTARNVDAGIGVEFVIDGLAKLLRPSQWIVLAGTVPGPTTQNHFEWRRVHGAGEMNASGSQNVTLTGGIWPTTITNTTAWIIENVATVESSPVFVQTPEQ